ncbi:MAG: hypothetical protein U0610_33285, partial [bacterium]
HLTAVPSPAGSADPSRSEVGPLKPIPETVSIGAEIFPLTPRDLRRGYRGLRGGIATEVVTESAPHPQIETLLVEDPPPTALAPRWTACSSSAPRADVVIAPPMGSHYFLCADRIDFHHDGGLDNRPTLWMPLPLRQDSAWTTDVSELGAFSELTWEAPHRVLGRARVITPAGSFENAVLIETSEPAHGDKPARAVRRTYYAANVGPVLVLVPEADGRWVADLVLESIVVPPPAAPPKSQP